MLGAKLTIKESPKTNSHSKKGMFFMWLILAPLNNIQPSGKLEYLERMVRLRRD